MVVSSPDLKAFLIATPFFAGLSDADLDLLVSMLVEHRLDAGATVVTEGETGRSMYVVHSGELSVSKLGDSGRSIRVAGLGPGDFFGEMTLIEPHGRSATVITESPTVLYELSRPMLAPLLDERPGLIDELASAMTQNRQRDRQRLAAATAGGDSGAAAGGRVQQLATRIRAWLQAL